MQPQWVTLRFSGFYSNPLSKLETVKKGSLDLPQGCALKQFKGTSPGVHLTIARKVSTSQDVIRGEAEFDGMLSTKVDGGTN